MNVNGLILLSLAAHLAVIYWFWQAPVAPATAHQGEVSIDLIEAVHHQAGFTQNRPRKKSDSPAAKTEESAAESTHESAPANAAVGGDPNISAQAASIYISQITELVRERRIYPPRALDREQEGRVLIAVTLARDGQVLEARIEEPSPFEMLNEAALKTVRGISHFPAIPSLLDDPLHLHIPLVFKIQR